MPKESSTDVPFLCDLDLPKGAWAEHHLSDPAMQDADARNMRAAWKEYLYHRTPAPFQTQVKNFVRVVQAEGMSTEVDDPDARASKLDAVTCTVTPTEVADMLDKSRVHLRSKAGRAKDEADVQEMSSQRMNSAVTTAATLIDFMSKPGDVPSGPQLPRINRNAHSAKPATVIPKPQTVEEIMLEKAADVHVYRQNYEEAFDKWWSQLLSDPQTSPYAEQRTILMAVHQRCVHEHLLESSCNSNAASDREPLFRLILGLPGSGKSQVMKWL